MASQILKLAVQSKHGSFTSPELLISVVSNKCTTCIFKGQGVQEEFF
jgi:hypothetical protein